MNLESEAFEMFVHEMLLVSRHSCGPGFHFTKEAENIIFRSLLNTFLNVQGFGTQQGWTYTVTTFWVPLLAGITQT